MSLFPVSPGTEKKGFFGQKVNKSNLTLLNNIECARLDFEAKHHVLRLAAALAKYNSFRPNSLAAAVQQFQTYVAQLEWTERLLNHLKLVHTPLSSTGKAFKNSGFVPAQLRLHKAKKSSNINLTCNDGDNAAHPTIKLDGSPYEFRAHIARLFSEEIRNPSLRNTIPPASFLPNNPTTPLTIPLP